MRRWLRWSWRWSWVVTVPGCALFALWLTATWQRWRKFSVDYDASPWRRSLHETGADLFDSMLWQARIRLQGSDLTDVPADQQLRSIQLFAGESELARLDENLPYSGIDSVEALLMYADGLHKVQMRYRGDAFWHWGFDKKTLRIKTKSDRLFAGMRQFHLVAPEFPEQLNNALACRLANLMGLVAPRCELVNVFLNGRFQGVHELTEQLDESTLRAHDRMLGDIYCADVASSDHVRGTGNRVFDMPQAWKKDAADPHCAPDSKVPLQRLLRLLQDSPSEATQAELSELLDLDAWGRFGAFELLVQAHRFDEGHDWRLYWDPWRSKFEPLIWDPGGWARAEGIGIAPDIVTSRLHQWLLQNGDYLQARHEALRRFLEHRPSGQFLAELDVMLDKVDKALRHDPHIRPSHDLVQARLAFFRPHVDQILATLRAAHLEGPGVVRWAQVDANTVRLQVEGRCPVSEVSLQFERPLTGPVSAVLRLRHFGVPHDVDLGAGVSLQDTLVVPARLFCQLVPTFRSGSGAASRPHDRAPAPATYDLCLQGLPAGNRLCCVRVVRAGTHDAAVAIAELPPHDVEFLFRATPPLRSAAVAVWRDEVVIDGVEQVNDDVSIEPGTVVRLGPGACLLFRGRVTAAGTRERPIRFEPKDRDQAPWGTVALRGPACSGSSLQWCNMRGGSGYTAPLEHYSAMFSIHDCAQVSVADCTFAKNHDCDDMIHAVYASVVFDRATVTGAPGDGLGCDMSTVVIRNCSFLRCKNDGVDLMATRALIHDCRFEHDGDKGISIGEGSHLLALRNRFVSCDIAMEARNGSIAHVANCDVRRCTRAMDARKKNWRYDSGGFLTLYKSVVVDNEALPTADRWSRLELIDCQVSGQLAAHWDQQNLDGTTTRVPNVARIVDGDAGPAPRHGHPLPFPEDLRASDHLFAEVWGSLRAETRGVPDGH